MVFRDRFLLAALVLQAALLSFRLDLATVWGDELFTLDAARQPVAALLQTVASDIHPPLYFLLVHGWLRLPLGLTDAVQARLLSVLFTLLATVLVYRLWLRDAPTRPWFLLLWTLSPCLLLYGRMARSYALQMAVAAVALHLAHRLLQDARATSRAVWFGLSASLLLYIHYAPGLAVLASVAILLVVRRQWRPLFLSCGIAALAYLPWLAVLARALQNVAAREPYAASSHGLVDQAMKLTFWAVSFSFGESLPLPLILAGALLAALIAWTLWRSARPAPAWLPLVLLTAVIGYLGVARWVSFPFVPARMLFVFPFFLLLVAPHARLSAALAVFYVFAGAAYFTRSGILNKAYIAPYPAIVDDLLARPEPPSLVLLETSNTDAWALQRAIGGRLNARFVDRRAAGPLPPNVVLIRTTRDAALDPAVLRLEHSLAAGRDVSSRFYLPYDPADRFIMRLLGDRNPPTHYLQVTTYLRR